MQPGEIFAKMEKFAAVVDQNTGGLDRTVVDGAVISTAISLKRIADALEYVVARIKEDVERR